MLEDKILQDRNEARKRGEKVRLDVLGMLVSDITNKKKEERADELDDGRVLGVIQKMVKRHKESIVQFTDGGRQDLVDKETAEMEILQGYLPDPVSEEDLKAAVSAAVTKLGASSPKDMGSVMSEVMAQLKGRADGKLISKMVREELS